MLKVSEKKDEESKSTTKQNGVQLEMRLPSSFAKHHVITFLCSSPKLVHAQSS